MNQVQFAIFESTLFARKFDCVTLVYPVCIEVGVQFDHLDIRKTRGFQTSISGAYIGAAHEWTATAINNDFGIVRNLLEQFGEKIQASLL